MKNLSEEDRSTLESLTEAVRDAIAARRQWLDAKMPEYADVPVDGELFDLETGRCVGIVLSHYRYWRERDEGVRDTMQSVEYNYLTKSGEIMNTSSQLEKFFGSQEQVKK